LLKTRVLAALVFAPSFLWLVWCGRWPLAAACLAVAAVMLWEFYQLTLGAHELYLKIVGFVLAAVVALITLRAVPPVIVSVLEPLAVLFLLIAILLRPEPVRETFSRAGLLALGAVYAGGLIQYLSRLRALPSGLPLALMALFCTWGADTGAYFAGRFFGRHKLYPKISPGKTVEGALGGMAAAIGIAFLVRSLPAFFPNAWHAALKLDPAGFGPPLLGSQLVIIGLITGGFGLVGDLCESMLKRSVGAKDSGQLIPGHGGALDRFDAVLFAVPGVYVFALLAAG
jgi:phosphatidate cytidylyltransferase